MDHQSLQLLGVHQTPKASHHVPESTIQTLLLLSQAGAVTAALGSCSGAQPPSG